MAREGITLIGERQLRRRLARLSSDGARRRIARPAFREAAAEIRKKAKANTPVESGLLKKSIKSVVRTGKSTKDVYAVIGPAIGFKQNYNGKPRDPARYAHLVEYGTTHSAAKPYLRPAYDNTDSTSIIARRMAMELVKEARRK